MLELRPSCECCDTDLPPDSRRAFICTFECTFCAECAEATLHFECPNSGGLSGGQCARPRNWISTLPRPSACSNHPAAHLPIECKQPAAGRFVRIHANQLALAARQTCGRSHRRP